MRVLLDGKEVPWDPSRLPTFGAVIVEATRRAAADRRIVHRIEVDGEEISTETEREMAGLPAAGPGELNLRTTTPDALLEEAIDGAIRLSQALRQDIRNVLVSIRADDVSGAKSMYLSCVESLGMFFQLAGAVFNGVRTGAFRLPERLSFDGAELPEPPAATTGILQRLLSARQEEDWPRMADLLEKEIAPNLEEWAAFFHAMKDR